MKCDDCKFSFDDGIGGEDDPIECRRFPPFLHPRDAAYDPPFFTFVLTERKDWCGEFKPKDTEAA